GPAWTLLYTLMAIAAWLVLRRAGQAAVTVPLLLFGVQLALNLAWSLLFFGARQPGWAMLDIGLLWLGIAATMLTFWRVSPVAGALFVPYLLWVTYASTLNWGIWRMNP
ncbi:MAG: TspO/MBR family protein, partial [Armatimonadota bacterium]